MEAPLNPPANPTAALEQAKRLHPTGGPYIAGKFRYNRDRHGTLPSPADVARKAPSLAPIRAPRTYGMDQGTACPSPHGRWTLRLYHVDNPRDYDKLPTPLNEGTAHGGVPKTIHQTGLPGGAPLFLQAHRHGRVRPQGGGAPCLEKIREHLPTCFQGIQFGAQYTQGCEHIIYNVRQHFRDRPKEVIVAADLENAFNSISRSAIFRAVRGDPKLFRIEGITLFSYGTTRTLHLGEGQSITNSSGVKQGDPMAPILFAIGIQGAIARVAANFTGTLKVWAYLDGVTFAGEPKVCAEALG